MKRNLFFTICLFITPFVFAQQKAGYYRYEGKLGPREAVLELAVRPTAENEPTKEIDPVTAYYYFKDDGIPILLYTSKDLGANDIVLRALSDEMQEHFAVHYDDNALRGRWYWTETDLSEGR